MDHSADPMKEKGVWETPSTISASLFNMANRLENGQTITENVPWAGKWKKLAHILARMSPSSLVTCRLPSSPTAAMLLAPLFMTVLAHPIHPYCITLAASCALLVASPYAHALHAMVCFRFTRHGCYDYWLEPKEPHMRSILLRQRSASSEKMAGDPSVSSSALHVRSHHHTCN